MLSYLIRRIGIGVITLLLITFVIYALIRNIPGTPLTVNMAEVDPSKQLSDERIAQLEAIYGLDKSWPEAYLGWLSHVVQGDFGTSFSHNKPVLSLIYDRLGPTLLLSIPSLFLAYALSIPMGIYCSAKANTLQERTLSTFLYMLYSFPSFVAALFLQLYLAVELKWFPLFDITSENYSELSPIGKIADLAWHSALPMTCYTYGSLAYFSRFVRANLQEVLRQDYIRTARAKGLGPFRVLWHHGFRNTLIPLVTLIGLTLPSLLSGSVIIEQIFSWPGMGMQFFSAIRERDYPTIMGLTLMFSLITLLSQLIADMLYAFVDPRVRLESNS